MALAFVLSLAALPSSAVEPWVPTWPECEAQRALGTGLCPAPANADFGRVCARVQGAFVYADVTAAAANAVPNDVVLGSDGFVGSTAFVVFGLPDKFDTLYVDIGIAGIDGQVQWQYFRAGAGFVSLNTVVDPSNHFQSPGIHKITFIPPSNWGPAELHPIQCPGTFYHVLALTDSDDYYTVKPLGTQASAFVYNLRVRVQDAQAGPMAGLAPTNFLAHDGSDGTVYGVAERSAGVYDLALRASAPDTDYHLRVQAAGYATSAPLATGTLGTSLVDRSGTPITLTAG